MESLWQPLTHSFNKLVINLLGIIFQIYLTKKYIFHIGLGDVKERWDQTATTERQSICYTNNSRNYTNILILEFTPWRFYIYPTHNDVLT